MPEVELNNCSPPIKDLPAVLWGEILGFLDVPSLGACACVSKHLNELTKDDTVWSPHLKILMETLHSGSLLGANPSDCKQSTKELMDRLQQEILPTSEDASESDAQRIIGIFCGRGFYYDTIMQDNQQDFATYNHPSLVDWLHKDLSARDYYKKAASLALWACVSYNLCMAELCHCTDCGSYCMFDCRCSGWGGAEFIQHCIFHHFRELPNIRLFRTPPVECLPRHKKIFCHHFFDLDGIVTGGTDEDMAQSIRQWEQLG